MSDVVWLNDWSARQKLYAFSLEDGTLVRHAKALSTSVPGSPAGYAACCVGGFAMVYRVGVTPPSDLSVRKETMSHDERRVEVYAPPDAFRLYIRIRDRLLRQLGEAP